MLAGEINIDVGLSPPLLTGISLELATLDRDGETEAVGLLLVGVGFAANDAMVTEDCCETEISGGFEVAIATSVVA